MSGLMMNNSKTGLQPAKWQVTATTIRCELVGDSVTIMVNKDWSTRCAWYNRYKAGAAGNRKNEPDKKIRQKMEKCTGPDCSYVKEYLDKLISEESSVSIGGGGL